MIVTDTIAGLRTARTGLTGRVATVMTMGALHRGHLALVARARDLADHVVVTVFVNPLQFGPGEDFDAYPRTLEADLALLDGRVDVVFAPEVQEMYPGHPGAGPRVTVTTGEMGRVLEGALRPGHFDGVATVVTKLLQLTAPHVSVFGQKDAQQLAIIRRLVADLDLGVEIDALPIVRDDDGLAASSRNRYLTPAQRREALLLSRTVAAVQAAAPDLGAARAALAAHTAGAELDYAVLVDAATLEPVTDRFTGNALVLLAGRFGRPRLLDNGPLQIS